MAQGWYQPALRDIKRMVAEAAQQGKTEAELKEVESLNNYYNALDKQAAAIINGLTKKAPLDAGYALHNILVTLQSHCDYAQRQWKAEYEARNHLSQQFEQSQAAQERYERLNNELAG